MKSRTTPSALAMMTDHHWSKSRTFTACSNSSNSNVNAYDMSDIMSGVEATTLPTTRNHRSNHELPTSSSPSTFTTIPLEKVNYSALREGQVVHDQLPTIEEARTYLSTLRLQQRRHTTNDDVTTYNSSSRLYRCFKATVCMIFTLTFIGTILLIVHNLRMTSSAPSSSRNQSSRIQQVNTFLSSYGFSNEDDLARLGSPQQMASEWIADKDTREVPIVNSASFTQRYALAVFYFAFDGPSWPSQLRFLSGNDICGWFNLGFDELENSLQIGVSCLGTGDVKQLIFPPHYLQGTFPSELQLLSNLEHLSIFLNPGVTGEFPTALKQMTNLQHLAMNYCSFNGPLPGWLGEAEFASSLITLMLSNNNFDGIAPNSLGKLTNLKALLLDDNKLIGNLSVFHNLSKLEILILDDNFFRGELGDLLDHLPSLRVLDISNNEINSDLPRNLFSLENLTVVDLHENYIHGPIPDFEDDDSNGNYNQLQFLSLQDNALSGSIPASLALLEYIDHLDLSSNLFTSTIPSALGDLRDLKYLFLSNNPFEEQRIPAFIRKLSKLQDLSLRATNLKGTIPEWMDGSHFPNLVLLDLHQNKLKGTLPEKLGELSSLRYLLLNDNQFHGTLPESLGDLSKLILLLIEKNSINGKADMICNSKNNHVTIGGTINSLIFETSSSASTTTTNNTPFYAVPPMNSISYFISDCGGGQDPEIICTCCTTCCYDQNETCNDSIALGDVDPVWERGYVRTFYDLGYVTVALSP